MRPVRQPRQTRPLVPTHPRVHRLPRHPRPDRHLSDRNPRSNLHHRVIPLLDHAQLHQHGPGPPCTRIRRAQPSRGKRCQASGEATTSSINRDKTSPTAQTDLQLSLLVGGSLRSPRAARPPAGPALLPPSRSSPAGVRAALKACSRLTPSRGYLVAEAVGSAALRSNFGASLEDQAPMLCTTGRIHYLPDAPQAYGGHDHSRHNSATPRPLRRPVAPLTGALPLR